MPAYLQPELDVDFGIAHCPSADAALDIIKSVIGNGQRIGCLVVVSPTYFGACADIPAFAKVAHAFDIPLIVDEAHGTQLCWSSKPPCFTTIEPLSISLFLPQELISGSYLRYQHQRLVWEPT